MSRQTATPQVNNAFLEGNTVALLTFTVGGQTYGLSAPDIARIIEMVAITHLPGLPPAIPGIINVQGKTVPVLDMRQHFGLPAQAYGLRTPIILVNFAGNKRMLGLVVDSVEEVVSVPFENLDITEMMMPTELTKAVRDNVSYLAGTAKIGQQFILVLNVKTLLNPKQQTYLSQALTQR